MTTDLCERETLREQMCGARVPQTMRTRAGRGYSKLTGASFDDPIQSAMAKWPVRSSEPEKQLRVSSLWAHILHIVSDGLCQRIDQWTEPGLALFSARNGQSFFVPVQILQSNPFHFTRSESVDGKQQENGPIAYARFTICSCTRQQALNVRP